MPITIDTKRMRIARLEKGYSQSMLAKKAGVALLTINLLESEKTKTPHPSTVKKICEALDLSVSDISTVE